MTKAKELSELASATTVTSGNVALSGGLDVDGVTNLDVVDIDGAVDMALTLAVGGVVTANAGVVVDTMTLDAATLTATGSLTIDATGDINLDADGADVNLLDAGTTFAHLSNVSGDFYVTTPTQDKDILIRGNDGGSFITALKFDMSDEGAAIFNSTIKLGTNRGIYIGGTSAANYLEDYEEGTFTPSFASSGTGFSSLGYSHQNGFYTKVGRKVSIHIQLIVNTTPSGANGNLLIAGLPFAGAANVQHGPGGISFYNTFTSQTNQASAMVYLEQNVTNLNVCFQEFSGASAFTLVPSAALHNANPRLTCQMDYFV